MLIHLLHTEPNLEGERRTSRKKWREKYPKTLIRQSNAYEHNNHNRYFIAKRENSKKYSLTKKQRKRSRSQNWKMVR